MKTKKLLVAITIAAALLLLAASAGCASQEEQAADTGGTGGAGAEDTAAAGYTDISPAEADAMIMGDKDGKLVVVDVSPVWAAGHLPGAVNMPLSTINEEIMYISKGNEYLVYCHADSASISGANTFAKNGFMPVYRLEGNYAAWTAAGYTVETPKYTDVTAAEAKSMMETDSRLVIVDVSPVYEQGHIPGAVSIPLGDIATKIKMQDKSAHYLVYCHSDSASISGAEAFMNAGFNPVYRLKGNYAAWMNAGYTVETAA